jgi:hypothetical protein
MLHRLRSSRRPALILALAALLPACADETPFPSEPQLRAGPAFATVPASGEIATLRRVTARYHDQAAAFADGFVLLHPCESRPDEGPVGAVYVHFGRLLDGIIDPETPDALIYEPSKNGREQLVGVEFALPYPMWPGQTPPSFMGAEFQREDEFGVYALHAWVWRHNPEGMFAESNPNVSCEA